MTASERFPITANGFDRMYNELVQLKTVERPEVIKAIAEARAHGDLSENAEYSAAREKQSFIEAKISDLESKIARAEVIETKDLNSNQVQFGAKVTLHNEENDTKVEYTIVSDYESDIAMKLISISSPVAKALLGKSVGDEVEVQTPNGIRYYEILTISY
jgi:transcription elongation factor GreA